MTTSRPEVGDLVHDGGRGMKGVVTDISRGRPVLRPLFGGGDTWIPEDPKEVKVEAKRGSWQFP